MSELYWIILFCIINGLVAFVGAFSLFVSKRALDKILLVLVAFSAGALLSGAFFHLLSENLEKNTSFTVFSYAMVGFIAFFILEKYLHWRHCHEKSCKVHPFSYLVLYGDAIHNFIDGLVIAASFLVSAPFGIITSLLIIIHEVPQELGDFGVLVYGGFSKSRALFYNFLSQLTCLLGGILGFFFSFSGFSNFLVPFAAGGFIYIGASDLLPELREETDFLKSLSYIFAFLFGILLLLFLKVLLN